MKVKDILCCEDNWTQGTLARDKNGKAVDCLSEDACQWCLMGAVFLSYKADAGYIFDTIEDYLKTKETHKNIVGFNDYQQTTFQDIQRLIQDLDL